MMVYSYNRTKNRHGKKWTTAPDESIADSHRSSAMGGGVEGAVPRGRGRSDTKGRDVEGVHRDDFMYVNFKIRKIIP